MVEVEVAFSMYGAGMAEDIMLGVFDSLEEAIIEINDSIEKRIRG